MEHGPLDRSAWEQQPTEHDLAADGEHHDNVLSGYGDITEPPAEHEHLPPRIPEGTRHAEADMALTVVDREAFEEQLEVLQTQLLEPPYGYGHFDVMVTASASGLPMAELADKVGIDYVMAIPTYKHPDGYRCGSLVVPTARLKDKRVLAADNAGDSHRLLPSIADTIDLLGGEATTMVGIARLPESGKTEVKLPDIVAEYCEGPPPKTYWSTEAHEPGVLELAELIRHVFDDHERPTAIIAVGQTVFTAATETAKQLGISGRYVGGLPLTEDMQSDLRFGTIGECSGQRVLILSPPGADITDVANLINRQENTGIIAYTLPGRQSSDKRYLR